MNKKIVMVFVAVLLFAACFCLVLAGSEAPEPAAARYEASTDDISEKVSSLFVAPKRKKIEEKVYAGGYPVGLSFEGDRKSTRLNSSHSTSSRMPSSA